MKKYRLIKTYPSLPDYMKVNSVVEQYNSTNYIDEEELLYQAHEIENFPEFWEEVKIKLENEDRIRGEFNAFSNGYIHKEDHLRLAIDEDCFIELLLYLKEEKLI